MLIQTGASGFMHPRSSEITPEAAYLQRREFLQWGAASGVALASGAAWAENSAFAGLKPVSAVASTVSGARATDKLTPFADASSYNNFYEFGLGKEDPARNAQVMPVRPWTVRVEGLVNKPQTLDLDALQKLSAQEERIHRLPELLNARAAKAKPQVDISFPEIEKFDHLPPRTRGRCLGLCLHHGRLLQILQLLRGALHARRGGQPPV